jgi:1,4-dihydroxy-6-naphthoate synthase
MFEPLVSKRINMQSLEFDIHMEDVERLNRDAAVSRFDITKMSFNAFTGLSDRYQMLTSGSALGNNCGPLLIARKEFPLSGIGNLKIAIPGYNTTAWFLLKYAFPEVKDVKEMLFSDIENAVLKGEADAGLIIHENRFTYASKGLVKLADMGEIWEQSTGYPIPLGGIAVRRDLDDRIKEKINELVHRSIRYAFDHPGTGLPFIRANAQEMDDKVMQAHIDLYVNKYSLDIGDEGRAAVFKLFKTVHPGTTEDVLSGLFVG